MQTCYHIKGEKEFEDWDVEREAMSIVDGAPNWHFGLWCIKVALAPSTV